MERYFEINQAGFNIRCKLYCRDHRDLKDLVIFCHGFGGHKDNTAAARFADRLLTKHKRAGLITFDLPCHGSDVRKKLSLPDCLEYLDLVVCHARDSFRPERLYACATSFGGYLVLNYLADRGNPFRRIALRCPAVDMHGVLTRTVITSGELERLLRGKDTAVGFDRKVPVSSLFLDQLRQADIRKIDFLNFAEDILILHGTADEVVPFEPVRDFCEEQLLEFLPIEGADHRFRDPRLMDAAIKAILDFYGLS